jgi:hypothetical protein
MDSACSKSMGRFTREHAQRRSRHADAGPVAERRNQTLRDRIRAITVLAIAVSVVGALFDRSVMNAQSGSGSGTSAGLVAAPVSSEPLVVVSVVTRGKAGNAGSANDYAVDVRCSTTAGVRIMTAGGGESLSIPMKSGESRRISTADFPTLTFADTCVAASTGAGTDVFYRTTSTPTSTATNAAATEPSPGMISGGRYQSAPAQTNGRTIEVLHAYTGDFLLTNTVSGPTNGIEPVFTFSIRCDGDASRFAALGNGQTRLITGVTSGLTCRIEQVSGGTPRFDDNSGDPTDGVVVIGFATPACWDLRTATPQCRSVVNVTNLASAGVEAEKPSGVDETTTTTTSDQNPAPAAPATTAAPAVAASPAAPVEATPNFTG